MSGKKNKYVFDKPTTKCQDTQADAFDKSTTSHPPNMTLHPPVEHTARSFKASKFKNIEEKIVRWRVEGVTRSVRGVWVGLREGWFSLQDGANGTHICHNQGLLYQPPGHVVVRLTAVGVCRADIRAILGQKETPDVPCIIRGHEGVGQVVSTGRAYSHLRGSKVVILPHVFPPNHELDCSAYANGYWHLCKHSLHMGFDVNGTLTELASVPVDNVKCIPNTIQIRARKAADKLGVTEDVIFTLIEPTACVITAIHNLMESRAFQEDQIKRKSRASNRVLLIGTGVMSGIWAIKLSYLGYQIYLLDNNQKRARLLRQQLGQQPGIKSDIWDPEQDKGLFDLVVVNTSSPGASIQSFSYVRDGGALYLFAGINKSMYARVRDPLRGAFISNASSGKLVPKPTVSRPVTDPLGLIILEQIHRTGCVCKVPTHDGRWITVGGSSGYSRKGFSEAIVAVGTYPSIFSHLVTGFVCSLNGHQVRSLVPGIPDFEDPLRAPVLPTVLGKWAQDMEHLKVVVIMPSGGRR